MVGECQIQEVCAFNATAAHCGIVNSPLAKLLNGVATRAKALLFFFQTHLFILYFSPLPHPLLSLVGEPQVGGSEKISPFIFHSGGHR